MVYCRTDGRRQIHLDVAEDPFSQGKWHSSFSAVCKNRHEKRNAKPGNAIWMAERENGPTVDSTSAGRICGVIIEKYFRALFTLPGSDALIVLSPRQDFKPSFCLTRLACFVAC